MESLFMAVLVTLGLTSEGVEEVSRQQFATVQKCEAAKRQREFTDGTHKDYLGLVYLCEWN